MLEIDPHKIEPSAVRAAGDILKAGGVVALPTETVYGLAADAGSAAAVAKIFAAKGRPQDNPLIVHIAQMEALPAVAREIPPAALALARRFWPGPLTMVLPKAAAIPAATSAGLDTVGVRMPSHPVMRAIIEESGLALAAPSANLSGRPSPTTARDCAEDLWGKVDAIVAGGACAVGVESTVVSLCGPRPRLLRPGAITPEQLEEVLGAVDCDPAVLGPAAPGSAVGAPGMKYQHYAPKARVQLVLGESGDFCRYVNGKAGEGTQALCFAGEEGALRVPALVLGEPGNPEGMARRLFWALREFDRKGAQTVYAHCPAPRGVGLAVYNRLLRAAAFDVMKL